MAPPSLGCSRLEKHIVNRLARGARHTESAPRMFANVDIITAHSKGAFPTQTSCVY